MTDLRIHDAYGFTQAMRRQLLLTICEQAERASTPGHVVTHTEEADGVTLYVNGEEDSRITYAELAYYEAHLEDLPKEVFDA
jgi:hypothetical protein